MDYSVLRSGLADAFGTIMKVAVGSRGGVGATDGDGATNGVGAADDIGATAGTGTAMLVRLSGTSIDNVCLRLSRMISKFTVSPLS